MQRPTDIMKRGFSVKEAAQYLGISTKTIYEAIRPQAKPEARARFPVRAIHRGKHWLFLREDLDQWLDDLKSRTS